MMKLGHHGNGDRRLSLSSMFRLPPTASSTLLIDQRGTKQQTRTEEMATVVTRQVRPRTYANFGILAYIPSSGGTRAGQWSVIEKHSISWMQQLKGMFFCSPVPHHIPITTRRRPQPSYSSNIHIRAEVDVRENNKVSINAGKTT